MKSVVAATALALCGTLLVWSPAPWRASSEQTVSIEVYPDACERPDLPFRADSVSNNEVPQRGWIEELQAVARLPEGMRREARFRDLLAATPHKDYPALGEMIASGSVEGDWRPEAGRFVTVWCTQAPLDATAWLLQRGSRLDTTTAAQAVRILAISSPEDLALLLDYAPENWSRDCLLAAAVETYMDESPEATLRWLAHLPDAADYRDIAFQAVVGALSREAR